MKRIILLFGFCFLTSLSIASAQSVLFGATGDEAAVSFTRLTNGTLYDANVNLNDAACPTHLVTINTTTGAISDVGLSVNNLDAIATVPEPLSVMLFGSGLAFLAIMSRRRRR